MWIYIITYFTIIAGSDVYDGRIEINHVKKFVDRGHAIYWYDNDMRAKLGYYESFDSIFVKKSKLKEELKSSEFVCKEIHNN